MDRLLKLKNIVKNSWENQSKLQRIITSLENKIPEEEEKLNRMINQMKEKVNLYQLKGHSINQVLNYMRKPIQKAEEEKHLINEFIKFEKLIDDRINEFGKMYVYIIERDIIDLINGHKADILGIEFQNTGKEYLKILNVENGQIVYLHLKISDDEYVRQTDFYNTNNYIESITEISVLNVTQNEEESHFYYNNGQLETPHLVNEEEHEPEEFNEEIQMIFKSEKKDDYELWGLEKSLKNVFQNVDDNVSDNNCVVNLCLPKINSRGENKGIKFYQEMEEFINENGSVKYEDMIVCFKTNGVGFTIRNINLEILDEEKEINTNINQIHMILYNNHCYSYKNLEDIQSINKVTTIENIKEKIVSEDQFIELVESSNPEFKLYMNGDFEQFCLSKYTQGKTTHYIMESNNNKDMYKFIEFIKPHMLKYTENMEEFDKSMINITIGSLFKKLMRLANMSLKESSLPILSGMKIRNTGLTKTFKEGINNGHCIDKNKEFPYIFSQLKEYAHVDITKHNIIDTNTEVEEDCFYNISMNIDNGDIEIKDFEMFIHKNDLIRIKTEIKGLTFIIKEVVECESKENPELQEFIEFLYDVCEENDLLHVFKEMMNQYIGEEQQNLSSSDEKKSNIYDIIPQEDACLHPNDPDNYKKYYRFEDVILKRVEKDYDEVYIKNAYNHLPVNWQIQSNSVIETILDMEKLEDNHCEIISCNVDAIYYYPIKEYKIDHESREIDRENYYPDREGDKFDDFFPESDYRIELPDFNINDHFSIGIGFDEYKIEPFKTHGSSVHLTLPYDLKPFIKKLIDIINANAGKGKSFEIIHNEIMDKIVFVPEHSCREEYIENNINNSVIELLEHEFTLPIEKNIYIDEYYLMDTKFNYHLLIFSLLGKNIYCLGDEKEEKPVNHYELTPYFNEFISVSETPFENYRNNFTEEFYQKILHSRDYDFISDQVKQHRCEDKFDVTDPLCNKFIICYTHQQIKYNTNGILMKYYNIRSKQDIKKDYQLYPKEIKQDMTFMCYNTNIELSRHKIYNKTHVIFNEFFMKDDEVYVNLTNMNEEEIEYNITFNLFSKNFYYNWCLTLYCVEGKSIQYRIDQETIDYLIKFDEEDTMNRKLYTLISRKKEKLGQ